MKIKRQKQAKHIVSVYKSMLSFKEPFKILIDGTFCNATIRLKNSHIKDYLTKYLSSEVECCTTRCVIQELETLGPTMFGAKMTAQRLKLIQCDHKKNSMEASKCLQSVVKKHPYNYFLATQDCSLTKFASSTPGVPLLYVHNNNIILQKISETTKQHITTKSMEKTSVTDNQKKVINALKTEACIQQPLLKRHRKRKAKGPNPLSCKPKKKKQPDKKL